MDFLHSSETDVAYYILNLANKPIFFKDLILESAPDYVHPDHNTSYLRANYPGRDGQDQDDSAISSDCRTGHRQTPQTLSAFPTAAK